MSNKKLRTTQGQMWDMFAKDRLGEECAMRDIVDINVEDADLLVFSGEMFINMPESRKKDPVRTLPPWER